MKPTRQIRPASCLISFLRVLSILPILLLLFTLLQTASLPAQTQVEETIEAVDLTGASEVNEKRAARTANDLSDVDDQNSGSKKRIDVHKPYLLSEPQLLSSIQEISLAAPLSRPQRPDMFAAPIICGFTVAHGTWQQTKEGGKLWLLQLNSPGALSLHVMLDLLQLPEGAQFSVLDPGATEWETITFDRLSSNGHYTSPSLAGEQILLEYYQPKGIEGNFNLHVFRMDYGYDALPKKPGSPDKLGFGDAGACNDNIECTVANGSEDEKRGIARISVVSSDGTGWCSGSLVNSTQNDNTPFFLTAFHCQSGATPFYNSWRFDFNYESETCSNPGSQPAFQSLTGCTERSLRSGPDFLLLEFFDEVPIEFNPRFNGWDNNNTVPSSTTGIHHPKGDIKKFCRDNESPTTTNYFSSIPNGLANHWRVANWNEGVTEGGSSGSPLFNPFGRIIGQLHGGNAACSGTADNGEPDWYGKFSQSWTTTFGGSGNQLKNWLDPSSSGITIKSGRDSDRCQSSATTTVRVSGFDITYRVSGTLTAVNLVSADGEATYRAGDKIVFQEGFQAESGSTVSAFISSCTPSASAASTRQEAAAAAPIELQSQLQVVARLFPNPYVEKLQLELSSKESQRVNLEWTDALGRVYLKLSDVEIGPALQTLELDGSQLPAGISFLKLTSANERLSLRVVKL